MRCTGRICRPNNYELISNLVRGDVVFLGDFQDALPALERLGGHAGFELGSQVSSVSFHRSDFGG